MSDALTLPGDLTPDEARLALRLDAEAHSDAMRKAAIAIGVRRAILRLAAQGYGIGAAIALAADDGPWGVSPGTAKDIWYQRRGWEID